MFSYQTCSADGCKGLAVSGFGEDGALLENGRFCFAHVPDQKKTKKEIFDYIKSHDKIIGLNANGLVFENIDLSNKAFYGCSFSHCRFHGLKTTGIRSRISTFEFSTFSDCNLLECNIHFTSFAGAKFSHVLLTGSDMIQDNFCGIESYQSSFDDSDLYNSRFMNGILIDTSFRNCNIKGAMFFKTIMKNVSFRQSNTNAAVFDERGSALFTGLEELNVPRGEIKAPGTLESAD